MKTRFIFSVFALCFFTVLVTNDAVAYSLDFSTSVARYNVFEVSVPVTEGQLVGANPYLEFSLEVEIRNGVGAVVRTKDGFYYGENRYVMRWMADEPAGTYAFTATLSQSNVGQVFTGNGSFSITGESADASKGPIRISDNNPIWFSDRNGDPFLYTLAWSHSALDISSMTGYQYGAWGDTSATNFNFYYDEAVLRGYIDAQGYPTQSYYDELDELIDDLLGARIEMVVLTADHMGWGFQCSTNWHGKRDSEFTEPYRYDPKAGLIWDHFLSRAKERGLYVKINLQEFCQGYYARHPFNHIPGVNMSVRAERPDDMVTHPVANDAWGKWVRYIVGRYGAYNNVQFQMGNEPPGDGSDLTQQQWNDFDLATMNLVKESAAYDVLYASGGPVGIGQPLQADYDVAHHTRHYSSGRAGISCFTFNHLRNLPYVIEEIPTVPPNTAQPWVEGCRYTMFAAFAQGGYGGTLIMWSWKDSTWPDNNDRINGYYASSTSLMTFADPVIDVLYDFEPDNSFIVSIPGEIGVGMKSDDQWIVYFQKDDFNTSELPSPSATQLSLAIPNGHVTVHWFDPVAGAYLTPETHEATGGLLVITPPSAYVDDFAVRVTTGLVITSELGPFYKNLTIGLPVQLETQYETGPVVFSSANLPSGMTLSADGLLSGTPSVNGDISVTITAQDDVTSVSREYVVKIYSDITGLSISGSGITTYETFTVSMTAILSFADDPDMIVSDLASWSVSDPTVALITSFPLTPGGILLALSDGTAVINASLDLSLFGGGVFSDSVPLNVLTLTHQYPVAQIVALPRTSGAIPLTVQFDASGSSDSDGSITLYEYDFDYNGLVFMPDASGATLSSTSITFDIPGEFRVAVRVSDNGAPVLSAIAEIHITTIDPSIRVNFQPASVNNQAGAIPVPDTYLIDVGDIFSTARGYGWTANLTGQTRDRDSTTDQRRDTLIHCQTATWEIVVPNGEYNVDVYGGDAGWPDGTYSCNVEGVAVFTNVVANASNKFFEGSALVSVSDGRLSLDDTGSLSDLKLNYIVITPAINNLPPSVDAGANQSITLPVNTVNLDGTVTDPDDEPVTLWVKQTGPGTVTFGNAGLIDT
ncbi:MAG: PKD domain-containing protein, partial [Planctomycetota bacterium]